MEEKQQSYIEGNLDELIRFTACHSLFLAFLEARELLTEYEVSELNSIENRLQKSEMFYRIVTQRPNFYTVLCEALKETGQSGALDILERIKPIRFDVHQPVYLFTGREEELRKLHWHLKQDKNIATLVTHTASVTGLGGIGKTELCRMYIQIYSENYDGNVIWIAAEKPEQMENSFKTLAKDYLNISLKDADGDSKEIQNVVDEVYNYFREKKSLFVFDNAVNSTNAQLNTFLPIRVSQRPHILITSRDKDWELPINVLELEELKEAEAIEFVKKGLRIQENNQDEIITALVTRLQMFPLAIQQAISFINEQRYKRKFEIEEYMQSFDAQSKLLLNHHINISSFLSNQYVKTTFTTWKITTDVISADKECGNPAMCILNMISYFEPEKIPTDLVVKHADWSEDQIHLALQILVKYSMISCQPKDGMINIHRLVQEVTRTQQRENNEEEETLRNAMKLHSANIEFEYDVPWRMMETFYPSKYSTYGLNIAADLTAILVQHISLEDVDVLRLEGQVAYTEYILHNFESCLKRLERILPFFIENKTGHLTDREIIQTEKRIAMCLKELERRADSLEFLIKSYQKLKTIKGVHDWQTIEALIDIIDCLHSMGYFKESPVNSEYLQHLSEEFSATDPQKIVSHFKTAYENTKHFIAPDSFYAIVFWKVAQCLGDLGDKHMSTIIASHIYEVGKNSNDSKIQTISMRCLNNLAAKKSKEGKHQEALLMYQESYPFHLRTLGNNHLHTLLTKRFMLLEQVNLGQTEASLDGLQDVLKKLQTFYPDFPDTVEVELSVAVALHKMKRYNDSMAVLVGMKSKLHERYPPLPFLMSDVNDWIKVVQLSIHVSNNLIYIFSGVVLLIAIIIYILLYVVFLVF